MFIYHVQMLHCSDNPEPGQTAQRGTLLDDLPLSNRMVLERRRTNRHATARDNEHSRSPKPDRSRTIPLEVNTMPDYAKTRSDITQALMDVSKRFQWDIDILALPEPDTSLVSPLVPTVVSNTKCNHDPEALGTPWILNSQSAYAKS